jgi:hypothetical protein
MIEIEYNTEFGLQNALHFCMKTEAVQLFNYLVDECKVPVDETDYKHRTPLMMYV